MSEDKVPGNLTLTLAHTLTGYCPLSFSITLHINTLSLYELSLSHFLCTHTHTHYLSIVYTYDLFLSTHRHPHSMSLHKHALSIFLLLSLHIHCLSLSVAFDKAKHTEFMPRASSSPLKLTLITHY